MKKRRDRQDTTPKLKSLWQAMDEVAFGSERTLNLRELLPSAAEARARTEVWLKARQVTRAEDVLIITGRGNQSIGGVSVVRQEVLSMLPSLRRRGIVDGWREHSPGSIVVTLAPISRLLGAGRRRREPDALPPPISPESLGGLSHETLDLLRQLAISSLDALAIVPTGQFIEQEMLRVFATLMKSVPDGSAREDVLQQAIRNALDEA